MADVERIGVDEARRHVAAGQAMLVCGLRVEGAIDLTRFKRQAALLPEDREIIFYCA